MAIADQDTLMDLPEIVPAVMSKAAFAKHMGHTPASVTQWMGNGMPVRDDGRINVQAAADWIAGHVRPKAATSDKSELNAIRAKLEAEKLRKVRLEADQLEGKLVERAAVARAIAARARMERDRHITWVQRIAPTMAAELGVSAGDVFKLLDKELRAHLQDVADTALPDNLDAAHG
ncbi:MAG: hypothetical protein AAF221_01000 [Pseudomonadota bacterium]